MKKSEKHFLSDRHDEYGSVCWRIYSVDYGDIKTGGKKRKKYADVRLTDCSQIITLDFDYMGKNSFDERIEKVDKLIDILVDFRTELADSWGKD